jgi:hypothetical protein
MGAFMAKVRHQNELSNAGGASAQKALLFEVAGNKRVDRGAEGRTLRIAALSLEEIIQYVRASHSDLEITEVKVVGHIEVLSSSEHLE